ncbi:MAG: PP2C family protein-serine/threonine phosphatase [Actinoplanes sp.]
MGGRQAYLEARPAVHTQGVPVEPWLAGVQAVFDVLPGRSALLTAVRDGSGRLVDLIYAATTREDGRHGLSLVGGRVSEHFPEALAGDRRALFEQVLQTGEPATTGPFGGGEGLRVRRLGAGLFVTWEGHGHSTELRLAEVERQLAEQGLSLAAEHELAARLQQIIVPIPEGPIELPGMKVAVRYLPAGQEDLVGGDWYHAAALRDGSVLLAVGDVAGHGTQAATTMAQLRHSLRALAVTTSDPAELLGHLNLLTCELDYENRAVAEIAATAVVARYEPDRRRLTWAQAGHPPPLLSRGGRTAPLTRPPGPMLGVVADARYVCSTLDLQFGDLVLFYTDGLVEHRLRGVDDGLAAVIATVDEAVAASPRQPLGELLSRLRQANPEDDTCILAARPVTGETQDLRRYLTMR